MTADDDGLDGLAQSLVPGGTKYRRFSTTVTVVTTGGGTDGADLVSIDYSGTDVPCARLASYTSPTVGHQVVVEVYENSPLILGRVVGLPPS